MRWSLPDYCMFTLATYDLHIYCMGRRLLYPFYLSVSNVLQHGGDWERFPPQGPKMTITF